MIRKAQLFTLLGALVLPFLSSPAIGQLVGAGYDLYQLDFARIFDVATPATESVVVIPGPTGVFDDLQVVGDPLAMFDFGDGLVDVGLADTIVQRLGDAESSGTGAASVDIELVALSLRSVAPVDVGTTSPELLYIGLDSAPSVGSYDFTFFEVPQDDVFIGEVTAQIDVNYAVRIGSPTGPLLETGAVSLGSQFPISFSHFPTGLSPFDVPDLLIDGVNFLLDGFSQEADFFQLGQPLPLNNFDDASDERFFDLAFEHANANEPGDSADNPILPDGGDGDTGFQFNDAPGRGWFDPPATGAYQYMTDGASNFVSVFLPPFAVVPDADGLYLVKSAHGDITVAAGSSYTFPSPVTWFSIYGIDPTVDGGDPLAFPTFLTFDSFSNTFTQTPVPEPAAWLLGVLALGMARRRTR